MDLAQLKNVPGASDLAGLSMGFFVAASVAGLIGTAAFLYGKKQHRMPQLVGGIALMAYPCFVGSTVAVVGIGALICAAMIGAVRAGF